ncbi:MAG TPA: radical SAM protein, partial [Vicinamibacterales bacterium]|nr:radical SAM protein [Vicinamibacterales bacterium]
KGGVGVDGRASFAAGAASAAKDGRPTVSAYDERQRQTMSAAAAAPVVDEAAAFASRVRQAMVSSPSGWAGSEETRGWNAFLHGLDACARFDSTAAAADAARFAAIYRPIGILPPDQYLSVVLQATEGCSFGTCTFCDLYHDEYRVKTPAEFGEHTRAVLAYLGRSIALRRRSIFLGAANALAVPMPRMVRLFEALRESFPAPVPPVRAFVDAFTGVHKEAADYARLGTLGLSRVYVGLESGHDPLLAFVKKPGTSSQAVDTVASLKAAGVQVGVIVMIGLGGQRFAAPHLEDTARAINAMRLGPGDILYFSDLVEVPGTSYPVVARESGLEPLDLRARLDQLAALRARLAFPGRGPQLARYDVREFVY